MALDSAGTLQDLFEAQPELKKIYYMMMMTVDPGYRGRGIASQLITSCFEVKFTRGQVLSQREKEKSLYRMQVWVLGLDHESWIGNQKINRP